LSINKFPEISVLGEQDALFISRERQNLFISDSWRDLSDRQNVVTLRPKRADYWEVAALVGEESHCSGFCVGGSGEQNNFFVRDRLGRVGYRGPDIFARKARVCVEQIVLGSTFCELPKDQFYFDPRSFDDRLAHHHMRIDLDSICRHVVVLTFRKGAIRPALIRK
jgi:hypothetical protein